MEFGSRKTKEAIMVLKDESTGAPPPSWGVGNAARNARMNQTVSQNQVPARRLTSRQVPYR